MHDCIVQCECLLHIPYIVITNLHVHILTFTGLGFSIAGGKDNQHVLGNNGIFVTKVIPDGAAADEGTLAVGDCLLQVGELLGLLTLPIPLSFSPLLSSYPSFSPPLSILLLPSPSSFPSSPSPSLSLSHLPIVHFSVALSSRLMRAPCSTSTTLRLWLSSRRPKMW